METRGSWTSQPDLHKQQTTKVPALNRVKGKDWHPRVSSDFHTHSTACALPQSHIQTHTDTYKIYLKTYTLLTWHPARWFRQNVWEPHFAQLWKNHDAHSNASPTCRDEGCVEQTPDECCLRGRATTTWLWWNVSCYPQISRKKFCSASFKEPVSHV